VRDAPLPALFPETHPLPLLGVMTAAILTAKPGSVVNIGITLCETEDLMQKEEAGPDGSGLL
jgi:hypothetical protein